MSLKGKVSVPYCRTYMKFRFLQMGARPLRLHIERLALDSAATTKETVVERRGGAEAAELRPK